MEFFFRTEESGYIFKLFGVGHILFLIGLLILLFALLKSKDIEKLKKIKNLSIITILIQQTSLYSWYLFSGYFNPIHSFPLYTCRVAMISLILGQLIGKDIFKKLGVYWGIPGSLIAFLYPVLDPFGIDHFTFYSFFLGHLGLIFACISIVKLDGLDKYYNKKVLKKILYISSSYNIIMVFINILIGSNYCYVNESPIGLSILTNLKSYQYSIFAVILFDFVIFFFYWIINNVFVKTCKEDAPLEVAFNLREK